MDYPGAQVLRRPTVPPAVPTLRELAIWVPRLPVGWTFTFPENVGLQRLSSAATVDLAALL